MGQNNNMQRPTLDSRHTSRLPILMNILSESYNLPNPEIASPDAPTTPSTIQSTPTHKKNALNAPAPPKEDTPTPNENSDMITSPEQIPTDIRVSCAFIDGSELAKKVRAVVDEAHRRRFEAIYYGESKDPSVATRMTKSSDPVQLPPFAREFLAKNMDLQRSRTETNANSREHVKPGFEGNKETIYTPVPAVDNDCEVNFRRIENSFIPIYTESPIIHGRTEGVEKSRYGEKKAYFGPRDDIPYFFPQAHQPCVGQSTSQTIRELSAYLSETEHSSPCSSSGGSQGSDDTTLTSPSDGWTPLGGDMETPKLRGSAAPAALGDATEAVLTSLGVTGSSKPVDNHPPPYQPLPEHSSPLLDGQKTPQCFADCEPTLSESSEEEIRGRTKSWRSRSTVGANSRKKHRNYTYKHRSPNTTYSPIYKRVPSPDWTELERQKTRALNIRLNGTQVLYKLKGKQSHNTNSAHIPSKLRKVPAIRSFAILDTPAASGFTASGMRHDLEDITEEVLPEQENAHETQASDSLFDINNESVLQQCNQETDSDESEVLFMKAPTKGWRFKSQPQVNGPEQELRYFPLPDMEVHPTSRYWGSQESLATTVADTEETNLLLTKVPARNGKQWAQEVCDGYEYHLLRHTNTASIRKSSTNGAFVIGTDEENQALLTRYYSPASPRINPINYRSIYTGQDDNKVRQMRKLCRNNSIPELELGSFISEDSVPMTPPLSPCQSFEEHQKIKNGLVSSSYPKIPGGRLCHDTISTPGVGSSKGSARASGIWNGYHWTEDKNISNGMPISHDLRVNSARIATDGSEASNPQPEGIERRGNNRDSGYDSGDTPQPSRQLELRPRPVTPRTSEDDTNVTRGRTIRRGRNHLPGANNTRPARSQPRRGTGRVSFAPLPDTGRRRGTSEGHIYHTEWSREQERSPSPSHKFNHKDYKYDEDEPPKIELPPVRKEPLKADSPPPEDSNAPARAISSQPYPYVHQRGERAQRSSDPMDLNNFVLPGGRGNGNGKGKGGKGGPRSMRAMVRWPSDLLQFFHGPAFGKRSSIREGIIGEKDPVMREKSTRTWHRPLTIRPRASVVGAGELLKVNSSISCKGEESAEKEDKADDSPPSRTSSPLFDGEERDRGEEDEDNDSPPSSPSSSPPSSPSLGGGGENNRTSKIPWGTTYIIDKDELPLYCSTPTASSTSQELEETFDWQEKRKLPEYRRLRVGSKTYVFDECHEIIDIHFPRKEKIRRHEPLVCGEVVNFSHITTTSMKEASPSSTRAKSLKAHLDQTRDSRLRRVSGSTDSETSPSHEYRRCYRCGKVLFLSCVCACDGDSDQRTYASLFTERNKGFHTLIPLPKKQGSNEEQNDPAAFGEYNETEERDVDDSIEEDPVAFPTFTGFPGISEINKERLDLIASIGSFNADEYERQEKRDPEFSEASEAFEMSLADLESTACVDSGNNQDTPRVSTTQESGEGLDWLDGVSALENGPEHHTPSTSQTTDTQERDPLNDAMAQTAQNIKDLVHIRNITPIRNGDDNPVDQRWHDMWREAFSASLVRLRRLLEQDDDRRVNARMDRQMREQEIENAEQDRNFEELEREIRDQERRGWYEWLDDLDGVEDVEWVQCMVRHMVATRISNGMRREWESYGC